VIPESEALNFKEQGTLESISDFPLKTMGGLWFRGQSSLHWSLRPGILRRISTFGLEPLLKAEKHLYREFRRGAIRFLEPSVRGSLTEVYFQAQHAGLPTRLLDWTSNPLAALYFAVEPPTCGDAGDAALFALDIAHLRGPEFEEGTWLTTRLSALFAASEDSSAAHPVIPTPIEPNVRYGRMTQQSARFTFHEDVDGWPDFALRRWTVPKKARARILYDLDSLAVTRATLFPDMDNLARHLRQRLDPELRSYGFGESLDGS
jgi:hypothetical protein